MKYSELSRWHNDVLSTLESVGLEITKVRKNGHVVVKGALNGEQFRWTTSSTPSGKSACRKMIADLRRELRRCGVEEPPRFAMPYLTLIPTSADVWDALWAWEENLDKLE